MESYKKVLIGSTVISIIAFLLFLYFFIFNRDSGKNDIPVEKKTRQKTLTESDDPDLKKIITDKEEVPLLEISLMESDKVLKELISECSDTKKIDDFLKFEGIVSRLVASVDNISRGESPVKNLDFLEPFPEFRIKQKNKGLIPDNFSFLRYDLYTVLFNSLDNEKIILLYKRSKLLIDKAYRDLGYADDDFSDTLYTAFRVLLKTPEDDGNILLKRKVITYAFVNQEYEKMNNAQKHFFRMGPGNVKIIKQKLKELGFILGFKF